MKKLTLVLLMCILPVSAAFAHPGKTDRYGGHKCLKGCEEWKLYFEEYHLHDKYGRPIRVEKQHKRPKAPAVVLSAQTLTPEPVVRSAPVVTTTVTVYRTVPVEEDLQTNPFLYILLVLLLLLLIVRMNRKRQA